MKRRRLILLFGVLCLLSPIARAATVVPSTQVAVVEEEEHEEEEEDRNEDRPTTVSTPSTTATPTTNTAATNTSTPSTPVNTAPATVTPVVTTEQTTTTTTTSSPAPVVISTAFPWAWLTTRAAGIASFLLMTLMAVTGVLLTTGLLYRWMSPAVAWSLHRAIASVLLFSVLTHLGGLLLDSFMHFRLIDLFVPFIAHYEPTLVALGVFGWYLFLLVFASSLYTMTRHPWFWRTVHFLGFPMYVLLLLHGLLIGTDSSLPWIKLMYIGSGIVVGGSVIYRLVWKYRSRRRLGAKTDSSANVQLPRSS